MFVSFCLFGLCNNTQNNKTVWPEKTLVVQNIAILSPVVTLSDLSGTGERIRLDSKQFRRQGVPEQ